MKILAGQLRGRSFAQPPTRTVRPLSEKVRAAIFDVTGPPAGFTVLDVYAGSGAAGFEALSRGAVMVEAIESNPRVARIVHQNQTALGQDATYILHQMTAGAWLAAPSQNPPTPRYQLIIADPPYAQLEPDILERLAAFLNPGGVLVISHSSKLPPPAIPSIDLAAHKTYGDSSLSFYKKD